MPEPIDPKPPMALDYASPQPTLTPPRAVFTAVIAILFAVCACAMGGLFLFVSVCGGIDALDLKSTHWTDEHDAAFRLLLCSAITIIPGIYYGHAGLRELNRRS